MTMEFTFDNEKIKAAGYTTESIYEAMKSNFKSKGLRCVNEGEVLVFGEIGDNNDYGKMIGMMSLLTCQDWFLDIASTWIFRENGGYEDVLRQVKEKLAKGELSWRKNLNKKRRKTWAERLSLHLL